MKKLFLLRHGEANPAPANGSDADRRLSERGVLEAQRVAQYMRSQGWQPDLLYVSTAARTMETAQIVQTQVPFANTESVLSQDIYSANAPILLSFIQETDAEHELVMLVGHNPTLYELAAWLSTSYAVDKLLKHGLPTCGLLVFSLDIARWDALQEGAYDLKHVFVP